MYSTEYTEYTHSPTHVIDTVNNSYSNWELAFIFVETAVDKKLDGESIKCTVHTFAHTCDRHCCRWLKIGINWCVVWRYWILSENFHLHHAHHSPPLGKWIIIFSYGHFFKKMCFSSFWLICLWMEHLAKMKKKMKMSTRLLAEESSPIIYIIHTWYICIRN
jgi:hypothetical protein